MKEHGELDGVMGRKDRRILPNFRISMAELQV
jgi:hypothetical protein